MDTCLVADESLILDCGAFQWADGSSVLNSGGGWVGSSLVLNYRDGQWAHGDWVSMG